MTRFTKNSQKMTMKSWIIMLCISFILLLATGCNSKPKLQVDNRTDAILALAEPLLPQVWSLIGEFADKNKIPIGAGFISMAGYDSIFGLIPQYIPQGRQTAFLVDKGTPAGTIPVLSAENFLRINYKAAKKLGLEIPEGLLSRAYEIIR